MLAHLKWVDIGINMPNTAISEVIIGFVEVTDGDTQTSLVLWKFCSFLCQCFYMECNENWTIRGGFDSRRNPARSSTRLREISFYLCSHCKKRNVTFPKKSLFSEKICWRHLCWFVCPCLGSLRGNSRQSSMIVVRRFWVHLHIIHYLCDDDDSVDLYI